MDEERDIKNAFIRAEVFLESMVNTKGTTGTHGDVHDFPNAAICDIIVDLMHYAERRNRGKDPDDIFYIDVNKEFQLAKKQFIAEKERIPLDIDPELDQLLIALEKRQQDERTNLIVRQAEEGQELGYSQQLKERFAKEMLQQEKKFEEERERHIRQYHEGRRTEREITKSETLSLDDPKRTK